MLMLKGFAVIVISSLVLIGNEDGAARFGINGWFCKFGPIFDNCPSFCLLFSSANASQKALWVMKLSLLQI